MLLFLNCCVKPVKRTTIETNVDKCTWFSTTSIHAICVRPVTHMVLNWLGRGGEQWGGVCGCTVLDSRRNVHVVHGCTQMLLTNNYATKIPPSTFKVLPLYTPQGVPVPRTTYQRERAESWAVYSTTYHVLYHTYHVPCVPRTTPSSQAHLFFYAKLISQSSSSSEEGNNPNSASANASLASSVPAMKACACEIK